MASKPKLKTDVPCHSFLVQPLRLGLFFAIWFVDCRLVSIISVRIVCFFVSLLDGRCYAWSLSLRGTDLSSGRQRCFISFDFFCKN